MVGSCLYERTFQIKSASVSEHRFMPNTSIIRLLVIAQCNLLQCGNLGTRIEINRRQATPTCQEESYDIEAN